MRQSVRTTKRVQNTTLTMQQSVRAVSGSKSSRVFRANINFNRYTFDPSTGVTPSAARLTHNCVYTACMRLKNDHAPAAAWQQWRSGEDAYVPPLRTPL